jgi:hypothetical protein
LPPLYIHSATGHPLSLRHSAQQRPMWGPSLQQQHPGNTPESGFDHMGRFYGVYRGRMGQQQLLLGPAAAAAGAKRGLRQGSGGSGELSGGTFAGSGDLSYSQIESESGDNGAAMMEDVSSSAAGSSGGRADELGWQQQQQCEVEEENSSGVLPGKRFKMQQQMGAGAVGGGSSGRTESSELLVVPSVSAGGGGGVGAAAAGIEGFLQRRPRFDDAEYADMMDEEEADEQQQREEFGYAGRQRRGRFGGKFSRSAASLSTACSYFKGAAGAAAAAAGAPDDGAVESIGEDDVMQQIEQQHEQQQQQRGDDALLLVAEAARLQELQLEATSRPRP